MEIASDPPCFLLHFFSPSTPSSNIVELSGADKVFYHLAHFRANNKFEISTRFIVSLRWPTTANATQYLLNTTTYLVKHNSKLTEHNNRSAINHNSRFIETHHNIFD